MLRRKVGLLMGVLAAVGMLTAMACGAAEEPTPTPPTAPVVATPTPTTIAIAEPTKPPGRKGELRVAIESLGTQVMDPKMVSRAEHVHNHASIWDSIVGQNVEKGGIAPGVALRWEINLSDPSWTFYLRPNQQFHNGDPLTAEDVKFSLRRTSAEDSLSSQASTLRRNMPDIQVINDLTVKVINDGVLSYFPLDLSRAVFMGGTVFPKKYIETNGEAYYAQHPVGSGPWVFVENVMGDHFTVEAWDRPHWRGSPSFERVSTFLVPEEATRVAMVATGEVALATISPASFREVKKTRMRILTSPGVMQAVFYLYRTYWSEIRQDSPVADVRVRQALSLAINRQEIIDYVMEGQATWPMPVAQYRYSVDLDADYWEKWSREAFRYDPEEAKRLLAEAGYPNGFSIAFYNSALPGTPFMFDIGQTIPGYWGKIGVDTELRTREFGAYRPLIQGDQKELAGNAGMYRMAGRPYGLTRNYGDFACDSTQRLVGDKVAPTPECLRFQELFAAAMAEPDDAKRAEITATTIQWVADRWVSIPILEGGGYWAVNPNIVGQFAGIPGRNELADKYELIPRADQKPWPKE